jgi:hypothetical protein
VRAGAVITTTNAGFNADYKGFMRGRGPGMPNSYYNAGPSHGGQGGNGSGGGSIPYPVYGNLSAPTIPGSGGTTYGDGPLWGGEGGGVIWIESTGTVSIAGSLTSYGRATYSTHGAGGAGGGIYINCRRFEGAPSGLIAANGGAGNLNGGDAGGGRIAVIYDPADQAGYNPGVRFTTTRGAGGFTCRFSRQSKDGTLFLSDASLLSTNMSGALFYNLNLHISNFTGYAWDRLTVTNCSFTFAQTGLVFTVTNDVLLLNNGMLGINGSQFTCRDLWLTNNGTLLVIGTPTNGPSDYRGKVIAQDITIGAGSWIIPQSDLTNGGSPLLQMRNLTIASSGGIIASNRGFNIGTGPGAGTGYGGGGHGGKGANGASTGGPAYGTNTTPYHAGSGGGASYPQTGAGGGAVRIEASGTINLDGYLGAPGESVSTIHNAGGAGGSVFVKCRNFAATSNAIIAVTGGSSSYGGGNGGGGGGGRIAVWRFQDTSIANFNSGYYTNFYANTNGVVTNLFAWGGINARANGTGAVGTVFFVITAPAVTNLYATNITNTAATLVGQLVSTGYYPTAVWCLWGRTDAGDTLSGWANTNTFGTNMPGRIFTNDISGLTAGKAHHFRYYATNEAGEVWAAPTIHFATTGGGVAVEVNENGATNITAVSATLRGVVEGGSPAPDAYICWGDISGGSVATTDWQHVEGGAPTLGNYAVNVTNLVANKTYYYTCYATNVNGDGWATLITNFTTLGPTLTIDNPSVIEGNAGTVDLNFTVALSVTSIVDVSVNYLSSNGTAVATSDYNATNSTLVIPAGQSSGTITVQVIGDTDDEYPSQNLFVFLDTPTNCIVGNSPAEGTIIDDDGVTAVRTWDGTGNWASSTNWSPVGVPREIDHSIINSGSVILSEPRTNFTVTVNNGATLMFTNWLTVLTASNITVQSDGTITLPSAFVMAQSSNRIYLVCSNFTLASNATVMADYRGFAATNGLGAGYYYSSGGGGHGGLGGLGSDILYGFGQTYDSVSFPQVPGSGGGGYQGNPSYGGAGGGAVRIDALNTATIFGTITANGQNYQTLYGGAGSGGAILLNCGVLAGSTNGLLTANGGSGTANGCGAGGGGRIAVNYDPALQALALDPGVRLQVAAGSPSWSTAPNGMPQDGTVYLPDTKFLSPFVQNQLFRNAYLHIPGFTSWALDALTISNASFKIATSNFTLTVTNHLLIPDLLT